MILPLNVTFFYLGIWGSAFSILFNQVVGGDADSKKSEEGEIGKRRDQNDFNLCSDIMRMCFYALSCLAFRVEKWFCFAVQTK